MAVKQTIPNYTNANKSLTLGNFKGIDASSSPFEVNLARATYCENLINENGVNHKRRGWKTIKVFDDAIAVFHVVFSRQDPVLKNATQDYLIVVTKYESPKDAPDYLYAGIKLYSLDKTTFNVTEVIGTNLTAANLTYSSSTGTYYKSKTFFDITNIQCFVKNNTAYIIGFDRILLVTKNAIITNPSKHSTNNVPDYVSHFYIPTTTISINKDTDIEATRASKEKVNLLNIYRRNTLIGNGTVNLKVSIIANTQNPPEKDFEITLTDTSGQSLTYNCNQSIPVKCNTYSYIVTCINENSDFKSVEKTGNITIAPYDTINGSYSININVSSSSGGSTTV